MKRAAPGVSCDSLRMKGGLQRRDGQRHLERRRCRCGEGVDHRHGGADGAQVAMDILIVIGVRRGGLRLTYRSRNSGEHHFGMGMAERQAELQRQRKQRQQR